LRVQSELEEEGEEVGVQPELVEGELRVQSELEEEGEEVGVQPELLEERKLMVQQQKKKKVRDK
jgi:hypothetical protein